MKSAESREMLEGRLLKIEVEKRKNDLNWIELIAKRKEDHLKRWTCFFETFPVGPNRSIEFWTEISGNFG